MKILLLCYEHPSPSIAGSLRALHSLKYLSDKYEHDITLLAFQLTGKGYPDLSRYCRVETIDIPRWPSLKSPQAIASALKTVASPRNVFSGHYSLLNYNYSPGMDAKVKTLLDNRFDALVVDHPSMLRYALGQKIPLVLMEAFALAEITWMEYKLERNWLRKIIRLLYHYQTRNYTKIYNDVDMAIAVSNHQRDMVKSHCPDLRIEVIPHGVDTDYFKAIESEAGSPGLIITGQMSGPRNKSAVLYFYNKIYSLIKAAVPQVKLYVVGSNPEEEILRLATDKSVIITGYVEDLRPYLSRAWVVVAPLQEGFGVKVRVLQAMAVGKPVVSSSKVMNGIDVSPEQDIIIADSPAEFAGRVIELLNDKQLRERIGNNARRLMETGHSWEKLTDRLNEVLEQTVKNKLPA